MVNVEPSSGWLATATVPPWASTRVFTIASPIPLPPVARLRDVEVVFHQAAMASVPASVADPVTCYEINVTGTLNLLLAARNAGVQRFVLASTSAVYGDSPEMPKVESMLPQPLSPYASSKLAAEDLCKVFDRAFGVETVALRYFNIFGPRQDPASEYAAVIPKFILAALRGETLEIHGDGRQSRCFCDVLDVVRALIMLADAPAAS
jgi:nucleoside-diphosphate-sugar epimerase